MGEAADPAAENEKSDESKAVFTQDPTEYDPPASLADAYRSVVYLATHTPGGLVGRFRVHVG